MHRILEVKALTFLKYVHTYSRLRSFYDFSLSNLIRSCGTWSACPDWLPIIGARALYDAKKVCSGKVSMSLLCMVIMGILRLLHLLVFFYLKRCIPLYLAYKFLVNEGFPALQAKLVKHHQAKLLTQSHR